jgi:hypothetical protein
MEKTISPVWSLWGDTGRTKRSEAKRWGNERVMEIRARIFEAIDIFHYPLSVASP